MPTSQPASPVFTAAGRHTLALVAREARADGVREVLAPRVRCTAMTTPFELEGLHVTNVDCAPSGLLDPGALAAALAACNRQPLILHAETFGNRAGDELRAVLAAARSTGARIVVDATHTALERAEELLTDAEPEAARPHDADYLVASLRKLLPIPLGGVVHGLARPTAPTRDELNADLAAVAAIAERHRDVPVLKDAVEDLLDLAWAPAPMPGPYRARLAAPGLGAELTRRRARLARLHAAVADLDVINPGAAYPPVIAHPQAAAIRTALARAGFSPPLHWPGVTDGLVVLPDDPRAAAIARRAAGPTALREALAAGEASGPAEPFDFDAFISSKTPKTA
ncbi:type II toxin-antitoxin system ParD family antitoxin [Actinomyces succiniciruminis]|uniref:Beta-eliminating lyase n=1 Tax=Actinomyces succiniciruminis TaxID=1522002 RepID=A0A1L7RSK7_9ACTO|nr:type II toxin-antitoxin system ParD family antitoxin [Actinomyces succiniciruminis]CED92608.1 Beta-eliminating lyase [Actinomyces succiniciruminis]